MNKLILKVFILIVPLLATVPAVAQFESSFQSTSSMMGSGSNYSSNPMIGSDGTATYSDYTPSRGRTGREDEGDNAGSGTQVIDPNGQQTPLGSAVPAMLLLAGAYAGVVAVRRRQQV